MPLRRILFGEVNPSGKLPETFPQRLEDNPSHGNFPGDPEKVNYGEGIYVGYRHYDKKKILSHCFHSDMDCHIPNFTYDNLQVRRMEDGSVKVDAEIKNTGSVPGKEVIQLYVRDLESSIDKPEKN